MTVPHQRLLYLLDSPPCIPATVVEELDRHGYRVEDFDSFSDLSAQATEKEPDLILIDLDRLEELEENAIQQIQKTASQQIPVLFLSTENSLVIRLIGVRAGGQGFMAKPVDIDEIIVQLDHLTAARNEDPYRVLIMDSEPEFTSHIGALLQKQGIQVFEAHAAENILSEIVDNRPDLLLMATHLPACTGADLGEVIVQLEGYLNLPIVYLADEQDREQGLEAIMRGGVDLLYKPVDAKELQAVVQTQVRRARKIGRLISIDGLTGLAKHERIIEQLDQEIAHVNRHKTTSVFAMLDLDNFKQINDQYGHPTGDIILKRFAAYLQGHLRSSDEVGRYGGEEFCVVMPDIGLGEALARLEKIRRGWAEESHIIGKKQFNVTFSGGLAEMSPNSKTAREIIAISDAVLYEAKAGGRNQVRTSRGNSG